MMPESKPMFASSATPTALANAEAALGVLLPNDMRTLYKLADGQTENGPSLLDTFSLMPLTEVVEAAAFLNDFFLDGDNAENPDHEPIEADPSIRSIWWSRDWIPLMTNGAGDYFCLDLNPAPGGMAGQIIAYFHDESFRSHVAPSLAALLRTVADGLEDRRFTFIWHDYRSSKQPKAGMTLRGGDPSGFYAVNISDQGLGNGRSEPLDLHTSVATTLL